MTKKSWLIIIVSIIVVVCIVGATSALFPKCDKEEIETFETYKEDFEKINKHIIENYGNSTNKTNIHIDKQIYQIVGLRDGEKITLDKETKCSLDSIVPAFKGYDFSFIQVSDERIAYGGEGYRMYVYSRNGKKPTYFYYKGDGVIFDTYKLKDGWYLLRNIAR